MQIVTRAEWGARPPVQTSPRPLSDVQGFCWHHSGAFVSSISSVPQEIATVRAIQAWCMDHNGYWDVDYEALIGPSGNIYQGRDVSVVEAAQSGTWNGRAANDDLLGICFIGDFTRQLLTPAATQAALGLVWVTAVAFSRLGLAVPKVHVSHNALVHDGGIATACPGDFARAWLATALHCDVS